MAKCLEEVVDYAPFLERPVLVTRGAIYAVFRKAGESDFIAGVYAFRGDAIPGAEPTHGVAELMGHMTEFCGWEFEAAA